MGTGCGQAEIPCSQNPDNRGDEQREDHRKSSFAADLQDQFHRQQRDDSEMMLNATKPDETMTPRKFQKPDQTTAT
jgi:hypothetical protein